MKSRIRILCEERTTLTSEEIDILEKYEMTLISLANLTGGDTFIDCSDSKGEIFVAAQAKPELFASEYTGNVCGMTVLPSDEPAVIHAFSKNLPFHGIRANTQENKSVSQDVAPIRDEKGDVIGVLISERDVSRNIAMEKKMAALSDTWTAGSTPKEDKSSSDYVMVREAHHRIKNHLQLLSSACNIRMREASSAECRDAMREFSGMIFSISSLHDMMSRPHDPNSQKVILSESIEKLVNEYKKLLPAERGISITAQCDEITVHPDLAVYIVILINELISNAVVHAFPEKSGKTGEIQIMIIGGDRYGTAIVSDNGIGLPNEKITAGTGLSLVISIVKEILHGEFSIRSEAGKTQAVFTFMHFNNEKSIKNEETP